MPRAGSGEAGPTVSKGRCACPDGCSMGWGWLDGGCGACHRAYVRRRRDGLVTVGVEAYRLPTSTDEPATLGSVASAE